MTVVALAGARQPQDRAPRSAEVRAIHRIERNLRCLGDDLDRLGLGDRAEFAYGLAASAREVAARLRP
ncbi:hypothetical protein [Amaricoccus sp.]|uniref:hypothetical protein n=1 Tax=Amaricoccus sp. TaxID=1872485 RepID=UPI001B72DA3E|nr:hypothetical protein [Amaricoccus sp.]MBP7001687.1 hypothetical protein [Amaricoccus sp.]